MELNLKFISALLLFFFIECCVGENGWNQTSVVGQDRALGYWLPVPVSVSGTTSTTATGSCSSCLGENCCFWECPDGTICQLQGGIAPTCQLPPPGGQVFANACIQPQCVSTCTGLTCSGITNTCGSTGALLCVFNI